ncbi:MAG: hypothetical protein K6U75_16115 [Firmicutes bacterium]|nr:hypothetical protein [Bacillota bacterium]
MSKTPPSSSKTVIWVIIAVVAIVIAAFSAYKSLIQPQQGKNVGFVDMFPGGKAGLMKQQPSPEVEGGAPAEAAGSVR